MAGPANSLVLGLGLVRASLIDQPHVGAITGWLGIINLSLAIFNIPNGRGPDPARILWRLRGDQFAATRGRPWSGGCSATC